MESRRLYMSALGLHKCLSSADVTWNPKVTTHTPGSAGHDRSFLISWWPPPVVVLRPMWLQRCRLLCVVRGDTGPCGAHWSCHLCNALTVTCTSVYRNASKGYIINCSFISNTATSGAGEGRVASLLLPVSWPWEHLSITDGMYDDKKDCLHASTRCNTDY